MKPTKFIRSNPHLPVRSLRHTLDYYRDNLGFRDEWSFEGLDGGCRRDEMRLIFGEDPAFTADINNQGHRLGILWFAENVDELFEEFRSRGIDIAEPPRDRAYGGREFTFIDLNGYFIRVAEAFVPPA